MPYNYHGITTSHAHGSLPRMFTVNLTNDAVIQVELWGAEASAG